MQKRLDYADELFRQSKYDEAAEMFEKLIAESPNCADNPLIRFNLAQSYIVMQQWLKALKELKIAEEGFARSEHFDDDKKQLVWFLRSMMHEKLNELTEALDYARKAGQFVSEQQKSILEKVAELEAKLDESESAESTRPSSELDAGDLQQVLIARHPDIDAKRLEEGFMIRELMRQMPKSVMLGDEWFIYSMAWLKKWECYTYFDLIEQAKPQDTEIRPHPGPVDCSNIIEEPGKWQLHDGRKQTASVNRAMKPKLMEGRDFMLVDKKVHSVFQDRYGSIEENEPIPRYGIKCSDGEVIVELYLKKMNFVVIPNARLFNFTNPHSIFVSRNDTLKTLEIKLQKALGNYLYTVMKNKETIIRKMQLWRSGYTDFSDYAKIDKQWQTKSSFRVEADLLSDVENKDSVVFDDLNLTEEDVVIVELPKSENVYALRPIDKKESQQQEEDKTPEVDKNEILNRISETSFNKILHSNTRKGVCGLSNLGNTCFMNSGLQCLSNTAALTKYFLMNFHKSDINKDNPLGMGGKLAKAYASLVNDMWQGTDGKTAPWDLKKTLGSKISRFSGFGQQDSAELVNYLLDLMHEDLNRVTKKPYVEMSEELNRPDPVVAKEYWDGFIARNRSIIVDLMYGQLKSTVKCHSCNNISTAFDPFLSIQLPIVRGLTQELEWNVVLYETHEEHKGEWHTKDMPVIKMRCKPNLTLGQVKEKLKQKLDLEASAEFVFFDQRQTRVVTRHTDNTKCEEIDQQKVWTCVYQIKKTTPNDIIAELNFYAYKKQGKKTVCDTVDRAIPRVEAFDPSITLLQAKRQLLSRYRHIYAEEWSLDDTDENNSAINNAIEIYVRDNMPYVKKKKGGQEKAQCEFCRSKHGANEEYCDLKIDGVDLNTIEGGQKYTIQNIIDKFEHQRELVLVVALKDVKSPQLTHFKSQYVAYEEKKEGDEEKKADITLDHCFKNYSKEELLTGENRWYCRICKDHCEINKKLELYKAPKILILQLKRFQSRKNGSGGFFNLAYAQIAQQEKIENLVQFPVKGLDMRKHVITLKDAPEPVLYDLYGVSNHFGSLNGGHYTATCYNEATDKWYYFNDGSVSPVDDNRMIVSAAAYLLFYKLRE